MEGSEAWVALLTFLGGCAFTLLLTRWVRGTERADLKAVRRVGRLEPRFEMLREYGVAAARYLNTLGYYDSEWYGGLKDQAGEQGARIAIRELAREMRLRVDSQAASFVADVVAKDRQVQDAVQALQGWVLVADLFWTSVDRGDSIRVPEIDREAVNTTVAKLSERLDQLLDEW